MDKYALNYFATFFNFWGLLLAHILKRQAPPSQSFGLHCVYGIQITD